MTWTTDTLAVRIWHGECLDALRSMPDSSVDSIVTDPPYGLSDFPADKVTDAIVRWAQGDRGFIPEGRGFMGRSWDSFVPPPSMWDECLRVLKPGGHMVVFAGARTVDLMGLSIRMSGFELRDTLAWIRGDGMPKGQEVSRAMARKGRDGRQWEDWHSALKPAVEPIVLARKTLNGTLIDNVDRHGTGALNVGACRISAAGRPLREVRLNGNQTEVFRNGKGSVAVGTTDLGRFPANVILDEEAAAEMDTQSGTLTSGKAKEGGHTRNQPPGEGIFGGGKGLWTEAGAAGTLYGDSGGASRFFYCAKAPQRERPSYIGEDGKKVSHVSVKPLTLMTWLVKMLTPPGGVVLDPFAGSGTTLEAALESGFRAVGCEQDSKHIPLIAQRISRVWTDDPADT